MRKDFFAKKRRARITGSQLVGGYLPLPVVEQLRLISLYKGRSVQNILQNIVEDWIIKFEPDEIIDEMVKLAIEEWECRIASNKPAPGDYSSYLEEVASLLKKRKISEKYIDEIMERLGGRI